MYKLLSKFTKFFVKFDFCQKAFSPYLAVSVVIWAATKSTPAYSSDLHFLGTIMQLSVL